MKKLTTIIFDLDGTLCNYDEEIEQSLLKSFDVDSVDGLPFTPEDYREEFKRQFQDAIDGEIDHPELSYRKRLIWSLLDRESSFGRKAKLKYARKFNEIRENLLVLFPEVTDVLKRLGVDYKLGLLTNGPSTLQWAKIRYLNIENYFDGIVVSGDHGMAKPDPEIFHLTLDKLSSSRSEAAYVGNSLEYDVTGAKSAGILAIWRRNDEAELGADNPEPDFVVENLEEIFELDILEFSDDFDSRRVTIQ